LKAQVLLSTALVFATAHAIAQPSGLPEQAGSAIGYPTVEDALTALRTKPGNEVSVQSGWTVVSEPSARATWSFVPPGHPAYPAVVRRRVITRGAALLIETHVLCQASKAPCDRLVLEFRAMNGAVRDNSSRTP